MRGRSESKPMGRPRKTVCGECRYFVPGPPWRGEDLGTCLEDPPIRILADCPACRLWRAARTAGASAAERAA